MTRIPPPISTRDLGRYRLHSALAAGGMASVHIARQVGQAGFTRTVAIKRLHPHFIHDKRFIEMMVDEARLASRVRHPNVVPMLDVVVASDGLYLVMELVLGVSLARLIVGAEVQGQKLPTNVVSAIISQSLHGLHAAHEATDDLGNPLKIVHRDISPQNIIVGRDGVARVVDFGVAKAAARLQQTEDGQVKGKLSYMAPEQVKLAEVDARSDIFSMGLVLWESLTNSRLINATDPAGKVAQIIDLNPALLPTARSDASLELSEVITKALQPAVDKRYQSAREMAEALEAAAPPALAATVGKWVEQLAGDELSKIRKLVSDVEAEYPADHQAPVELRSEPPRAAIAPDPSASSTATSLEDIPTRIIRDLPDTVTELSSVVEPNARKTTGVWWLAGAACVLAVLAFLSLERGAFGQLPEQKTPAASANMPPPSPSQAAPDPVAAKIEVAPIEEETPIQEPGSQQAEDAPPVTAPTPVKKAQVKPPSISKSPPTSTCNPPYEIVDGMKRFRPECL